MMIRFGFPITGAGAQIQLYSPTHLRSWPMRKGRDLTFIFTKTTGALSQRIQLRKQPSGLSCASQ